MIQSSVFRPTEIHIFTFRVVNTLLDPRVHNVHVSDPPERCLHARRQVDHVAPIDAELDLVASIAYLPDGRLDLVHRRHLADHLPLQVLGGDELDGPLTLILDRCTAFGRGLICLAA